jgi:hypothetical protein
VLLYESADEARMNGVKHVSRGATIASLALVLGGCNLEPAPSPNVIVGGGETDYGGAAGEDAATSAAPTPDASTPIAQAASTARAPRRSTSRPF